MNIILIEAIFIHSALFFDISFVCKRAYSNIS
jgi:hypothetical protein